MMPIFYRIELDNVAHLSQVSLLNAEPLGGLIIVVSRPVSPVVCLFLCEGK